MLETSNFVHGSVMRSLSLMMSECSLSWRSQGHVSNFASWLSAHVYYTLPYCNALTSYLRRVQDLSYK